MITIRCSESQKELVNALLKDFKKDNSKKKHIDIIIDALKVYEEYRTRVKAKVEQATKEVWREE